MFPVQPYPHGAGMGLSGYGPTHNNLQELTDTSCASESNRLPWPEGTRSRPFPRVPPRPRVRSSGPSPCFAVVVHIPAGYTASMAEPLNRQSVMRVQEAQDGKWIEPGLALLAPGGQHLTLAQEGGLWRYTVDQLFISAASAGTLGVVMTGMGEDGVSDTRRSWHTGRPDTQSHLAVFA